ncbi:DUF126 domain-containing protein [Polaromonas sp. P1-6]|nr:DUF126 domain-containing protein [Polaromonas sp. P1-6]
MASERITAAFALSGEGRGTVLLLQEPLSFWGGLDACTGLIIDERHPQYGKSIAGSVLGMSTAKGSSSSSSVLAEAIRNGTGPVAIVMREADLIVALGCIVASELYAVDVPLVTLDEDAWNSFVVAADRGLSMATVTAAEAWSTVDVKTQPM